MTMVIKGLLYSVLSGLFASAASLSGKFAMSGDDALWLCELTSSAIHTSSGSTVSTACQHYLVLVRMGFGLLLVLSNIFMWTTFVKALRYSASSLEAAVTNTAANFFFTAFFGQVLFGEFLTLMWWIGTVLIVFGLLLIHMGNQQAALLKQKRKKRS